MPQKKKPPSAEGAFSSLKQKILSGLKTSPDNPEKRIYAKSRKNLFKKILPALCVKIKEKVPGSDLLSHGYPPQYHRRWRA